jgi:hypothetical protein
MAIRQMAQSGLARSPTESLANAWQPKFPDKGQSVDKRDCRSNKALEPMSQRGVHKRPNPQIHVDRRLIIVETNRCIITSDEYAVSVHSIGSCGAFRFRSGRCLRSGLSRGSGNIP